MDPITQAALGACATQSSFRSKHLLPAAVIGGLAGMAPDLDVLIRSTEDPLLFLEYHRQFTHSLIFIPVGALICSLVLHPLIGRRFQQSFLNSLIMCLIGYATHALLDACTTYGTLLFWPFSLERIAWNNLAVIDPAYTLPILLGIIFSIKKQKTIIAYTAFAWVFIYPCIGMYQHNKAEQLIVEVLQQNPDGQKYFSISAKPTLGNLVLWKVVYETKEEFYVDAVRIGFFESAAQGQHYPGSSIKKLKLERDFPWLDVESQQAKDIARFAWFSNNYLAKDPLHDNSIIDIRYSMIPNEVNGLWRIELDPTANSTQHVAYKQQRDTSPEKIDLFFNMLLPN